MSVKWYIGQPIVAIRTHSQGVFSKGEEFIIEQLKLSNCSCKDISISIGIISNTSSYICKSCGDTWEDTSHGRFFSENNFAPLDTDISELTEILEKELVNKDYEI